MRELALLLAVAVALTIAYWVPVHILEPLRAKRALYAASGESRILSENRAAFASVTVVALRPVDGADDSFAFSALAERLMDCRYSAVEQVRLAKDADPVAACMGLQLLGMSNHRDFQVRFSNDRREVEFRANGATSGRLSVAGYLRRHWGLDDFANQYSWQLRLFGVVLFT